MREGGRERGVVCWRGFNLEERWCGELDGVTHDLSYPVLSCARTERVLSMVEFNLDT